MFCLRKSTKYPLLLLLALLFQLFCIPSAYAAPAMKSNIDAVLVVDVSGSMNASDKNKVSNEAMKMFVDMSSLQGDKIGVVAYTDQVAREKAPITITSEQDKNEIKSFINKLENRSFTDIAVGVKEAVKILESGHDPSHYPMVVLLADGNNALDPKSGRTQQQSDREMQQAIQTAKANAFPIYTIGLNADGKLNKTVLEKIAAETDGKFFMTNTADSLPKILSEIFADHLKLKVVPLKSLVANGQFQDVTISIPNSNVLEANISLMSTQPVEAKLFDNTGQERKIPSSNVYYSKSNAYSLIKLVKPAYGDWKLKVKGINQNKIDINLVFNYDLELKMDPLPAKKYSAGDTIKVNASFETNGAKVANPDLYKNIKSVLLVTDLQTKQVHKIDLHNTGTAFTGDFKLPEAHSYEVKVRAEEKSFYRETQPVTITAGQGATGVQAAKQPVEKPFPWMLTIGSILGLLLVAALVIFLLSVVKKANKGFTGQLAIEIRDENTGEKTSPQYKKLHAFKGKVKLHQLLQLAPEFAETDKIVFFPGRNDTVILKNNSACVIEKAGRALDASKGIELKNNDRIRISLQSIEKSISLEFIL
ncbi:vWA domain-containing protein [Aneurinibacillus tyrosinisolvens]|uniref:vWA domain-containing protein n=1 Tax=Aneurinibacillus tyrosinisolvens TaxID=1443435 RepID=UPI00069942D2|nr:vWA domain-containing protein [Aneurinibacillus tyrosinisolvens]